MLCFRGYQHQIRLQAAIGSILPGCRIARKQINRADEIFFVTAHFNTIKGINILPGGACAGIFDKGCMKTGGVNAVIHNKPGQHHMIAGLRHILRIIRHAKTQTVINMSDSHVANVSAFEWPADAASGAGALDRKNNFGPQRQYLVDPLCNGVWPKRMQSAGKRTCLDQGRRPATICILARQTETGCLFQI